MLIFNWGFFVIDEQMRKRGKKTNIKKLLKTATVGIFSGARC